MFTDNGFAATYGRGVATGLGARLGPAVIVTQPEPWAILEPVWGSTPVDVVFAADLTVEGLERVVEELPDAPMVVGIGGGAAMDTAKWIHWRRQVPLHQVPSLPSVDASFTRMTALRDGDRVRYEGDSVPECVWVDFDLMRAAGPSRLAAGIGDVLSCHTARWDWELATRRGQGPAWDAAGAAAALDYLAELADLAPHLASGEDDGIHRLMECHRDIGWRCHALGHARFEEGSEHFFAYCFEAVTGRTIMHGELVTLGVLVMSALQGNAPDRARAIVKAAGTRHELDALGVTWEEVEATLRRLPDFVRDGAYWYSVVNELEIGATELAIARSAVPVGG